MSDFAQLFASVDESERALTGLEGLLDSPAVDDETRALVADTLSALRRLDRDLSDRMTVEIDAAEIEADSADYRL